MVGDPGRSRGGGGRRLPTRILLPIVVEAARALGGPATASAPELQRYLQEVSLFDIHKALQEADARGLLANLGRGRYLLNVDDLDEDVDMQENEEESGGMCCPKKKRRRKCGMKKKRRRRSACRKRRKPACKKRKPRRKKCGPTVRCSEGPVISFDERDPELEEMALGDIE